MTNDIQQLLGKKSCSWLVSGVAGFIGSNLAEYLLSNGQVVVGLDNFSTGYRHNMDSFINHPGFTFVEGDICDLAVCHQVCKGIDFVLHHAALGSVPMSIDDPVLVNRSNIDGFLNMLVAAKDAKVRNFVYATSSAVYGDEPGLPQKEDKIGKPLSPYALTKRVNEMYAAVFAETYGFHSIGLRYFNVFGKRQDPKGAYAAVIPIWFDALLNDKPVFINGDGSITRDFCYIDNVIQANILAAYKGEKTTVFNIALGGQTSLNELFYLIKDYAIGFNSQAKDAEPQYRPFRKGDIVHSVADISAAKVELAYEPIYTVRAGLEKTAAWYAGRE